MHRLNLLLNHMKAFGATRPVALGVPLCAIVGALAGLAMQTGLQDAPFQPDMEPVRTRAEANAEPIAYPSGDLPDYVVGTDFLKAMQSPPVAYENYEPQALPPPPELPPYVPARHGLADRPAAPEATRWPSERGDILDRSLPEDRRAPPDALMLADVAATGAKSR